MPAKSGMQKASELYQLKVTLDDTRPPIWRRIQVPASITLNQLHEIIQEAMGWSNYHLHLFEIGRATYTAPGMDEDWDDVGSQDEDDTQFRLQEVLSRPGQKFRFKYDFGAGGATRSWWRRFCLRRVASSTLFAWMGGVPARRKIAAGRGDTMTCSKQFAILTTNDTMS